MYEQDLFPRITPKHSREEETSYMYATKKTPKKRIEIKYNQPRRVGASPRPISFLFDREFMFDIGGEMRDRKF